jgi:radical SAM protein with 4Fe4S-binding SPASM domain
MGRFEFNSRARRLQRYLGIALGRPLVGPEVVSLETTHHCNLRCSFCESHGILQKSPITERREYVGGRKTMELRTIQRLAVEMAGIGTDLVELSGKGDPISHPDLAEIVVAIKEAGLNCSLVTNATLAKPDLASTLVECGLNRLSVSLNAGTREVFLRSNNRDLWDKAIQFLEDVLEERRRAGAEYPWIRITHVVTKENVDDMDNMVKICADLGVDEVGFCIMGELPETTHLRLQEEEVEWVQAGVDGWCRILDQANVAHTLPTFARDLSVCPTDGQPQYNPLQREIPCYIGWNFCVIGPDGVVIPCCYCEETKLGNVNDQAFADIWYGSLYQEFRRASLDMPRSGKWICKECFTSCNRALENCWIYNRFHPFKRVQIKDSVKSVKIF